MLHRKAGPPVDPFTDRGYMIRFGLTPDLMADDRLQRLLTYKKGLDNELKRLKADREAYPDQRIEQVATYHGLSKSDLQLAPIARFLKSILDSEDYIFAIRRHKRND